MEAVAVNDQPSTNTPGNEDGPLVAVSFQKNPHHAQKYLEAEPKALGLSQITLSVFQISMVLGGFLVIGSTFSFLEVFQLIGSLFVIIAGSIAIAARNLHLPTLKACLGMQVVACVTSVICVILDSGSVTGYRSCRHSRYDDSMGLKACQRLTSGIDHYNAVQLLINIAILAICVTLAAYCCKIINCCTPRASMMVISVRAPPAQQ